MPLRKPAYIFGCKNTKASVLFLTWTPNPSPSVSAVHLQHWASASRREVADILTSVTKDHSTAQRTAGHRSVRSTLPYCHSTDDDLKIAVGKI